MSRPSYIRLALRLLGAGLLVILQSSALSSASASRLQAAAAANPIPQTPNIISIMVDDLDYLTLDTMLRNGKLPYFTRYIASESVEFKQSFVTNALCCPSRATFFSGQYTHNHKTYSTDWPNGLVTAFDDEQTLPVWLQQHGYRTAHVGKYLNGYGALSQSGADLETDRATWDARVGVANRLKLEPTYIPPGWSEWYGLLDTWTYCVYNFVMNENRSVRLYLKDGSVLAGGAPLIANTGITNNYQTDVLTTKVKSFIERSAGAPFYLSIAPLAPHVESCDMSNAVFGDTGPTLDFTDYRGFWSTSIRPAPRHAGQVPALKVLARAALTAQRTFNEEAYHDKPLELRTSRDRLGEAEIEGVVSQFANRMAAMLAVDEMIGALGAQLATSGIANDTVIIFTSDNGWSMGQHRLSSKLLAYEESIRVPLFVRLPGVTAQSSSRTVINNDHAPTILELAGGTAPASIDGTSYVPLLRDPAIRNWRRRFIVEHYISAWDDEAPRAINHYSLSAIRTTDEAARVPLRLFTDYFSGMQYANGWYASKPALDDYLLPITGPDSDNILLTTPIDSELYNKVTDPYEEENLLFNLAARPNAGVLMQERQELRAWMRALVQCAGASCRDLETRP